MKPAVLAKIPVAPAPTPSAAKSTGPIQQRDARNAAKIPPIEAMEAGLVTCLVPSLSWNEGARKCVWLQYLGSYSWAPLISTKLARYEVRRSTFRRTKLSPNSFREQPQESGSAYDCQS